MSDITYGALTFSDQITTPASGSSYSLSWSTFRESPVGRAEVMHTYPGVDGVESVDQGERETKFVQTGRIHAASEANLAAGRAAIRAEQDGTAATLSALTETYEGVTLEEYSFGVIAVGRLWTQEYTIRWRKN